MSCRRAARSAAAVLLPAALLVTGGCGDGGPSPSGSGASGPGASRPGAGADADGAIGAEGATAIWFREEAAERGLDFVHRTGHDGEHYPMPEVVAGGAALVDVDDDGDLDAYFVQAGRANGLVANKLYENNGAGHFRDVSEGSGAEDGGYGMGVACGDVDGDGRVDLYVTNLGANTLLANRGGGRFEDVTAERGGGDERWGTSAAFFDADRDGDLDLYVVDYVNWTDAAELTCSNEMGQPDYCSPLNYRSPARDTFYRNADGELVDETEAAGMSHDRGNGLGVGTADFDGDGWTDLFVANDGTPDFLWMNRGGERFENEAALAGCAVDLDGVAKAGMGVALADLDDSGEEDLLVCNLHRESDSLYLNRGGLFTDRTAASGLGTASKRFTRFGLGFFDFDDDGLVDLYQANGRVMRQAKEWAADPYAEPNLVFRGEADGRFREVLPRGGTRELLVATSRSAVFGDVDGDGGLDVLVVNRDGPAHLFVNAVADRGRALALDVRNARGAPALGAAVELRRGARTTRTEVRSASSYLAGNDPRVHVGLGESEVLDAAIVTWIDGSRERFGPLAAGAVHQLAPGGGSLLPAPANAPADR